MQTVLVHDFLPAYGRQGLTEDARVCFAGQRSAQIFDTDFEAHVGTVQRELAVRFRSAGNGASLLSLSRPSHVVLVHKGRSRREDDELRGWLTGIAEHLDRCGIAVGSVELVESLREAIGDYAATCFVCPTVFSRDVAECFCDNGATAMRLAILHLQNKANFTQLLSSKSPNSVRVHKTSGYNFPGLQRIAMYCHGKDLWRRSPVELAALRSAGITVLFVGLESGPQTVLDMVKKGCCGTN
jgi:hypothetical protein